VHIIIEIIIIFVCLKAVIIGSSFNFFLYFKHGQKYSKWYFDPKRTTFHLWHYPL